MNRRSLLTGIAALPVAAAAPAFASDEIVVTKEMMVGAHWEYLNYDYMWQIMHQIRIGQHGFIPVTDDVRRRMMDAAEAQFDLSLAHSIRLRRALPTKEQRKEWKDPNFWDRTLADVYRAMERARLS